jgi:hypothetical protein
MVGLRVRLTKRLSASLMGEQASVSPTGFDYIGDRPSGNRVAQRIRLAVSMLPDSRGKPLRWTRVGVVTGSL